MIFDKLPMSIDVDGKSYPIKTDFREWIAFEMLIGKKAESEAKAQSNICKAILNVINEEDIPNNFDGTVTKLLDFYLCNEQRKGIKSSKSSGEKTFDYQYDSGLLYSAFVGQYGIDLQEIKYLHWFKFKSLFSGLKPDCRLIEIMGYRGMKIDPKMPRSQKEFYNEMKKIYALPVDENLLEIVKRQREEYRKANQ